MCKFFLIVFFTLVACVQARAADEFDSIRCGADIPKAMIGKHAPNERVVVTEARHSDLGLKDLGGDEISDRLSCVLWRICGDEYEELIDKKNLVRDVLPIPTPQLYSPVSIFDVCNVDGKELRADVIAVLNNGQRQKPKSRTEEMILPATVAWRIDERLERFVPMPTKGLNCSADDFGPELKQ